MKQQNSTTPDVLELVGAVDPVVRTAQVLGGDGVVPPLRPAERRVLLRLDVGVLVHLSLLKQDLRVVRRQERGAQRALRLRLLGVLGRRFGCGRRRGVGFRRLLLFLALLRLLRARHRRRTGY